MCQLQYFINWATFNCVLLRLLLDDTLENGRLDFTTPRGWLFVKGEGE